MFQQEVMTNASNTLTLLLLKEVIIIFLIIYN